MYLRVGKELKNNKSLRSYRVKFLLLFFSPFIIDFSMNTFISPFLLSLFPGSVSVSSAFLSSLTSTYPQVSLLLEMDCVMEVGIFMS